MKSLGKQMKVILTKGKSILLSVDCCHILRMIFYLLDSENKNDDYQELSLSSMIQQSWSKRKHQLEHDYAITAWALSLLPEIRKDVAERMDGNEEWLLSGSSPNFIYRQIQTPKHLKSLCYGRNLMISRIRLDPMDIVLEDS